MICVSQWYSTNLTFVTTLTIGHSRPCICQGMNKSFTRCIIHMKVILMWEWEMGFGSTGGLWFVCIGQLFSKYRFLYDLCHQNGGYKRYPTYTMTNIYKSDNTHRTFVRFNVLSILHLCDLYYSIANWAYLAQDMGSEFRISSDRYLILGWGNVDVFASQPQQRHSFSSSRP